MNEQPSLQEVSQSELDSLLAQQKELTKYRAERPSLANLLIKGLVIPTGFNFLSADLSGTRFEKVDLDGCDFQFAILRGVEFRSSRVRKCNFYACESIEGIVFQEVHDSKFEHVSFAECNLHEKWFENCSFRYVEFSGARLEFLNFVRCQFRNCTFAEAATIKSVDFHGARLTQCDLHEADFSTCSNFVLDGSDVHDLRLPVRSSDPWSQLVRSYTGTTMLFNLLFLGVFFSPLILKGLGLIALGHIEAHLGQRASGSSPAEICQAIHCKAVPVWRALLGPETSFWVWSVGIVLLAYNAIRALLTWRIAPLKEEQQVSAKTPIYFPDLEIVAARLADRSFSNFRWLLIEIWHSYAPFWWLHRIIKIVFWFAIALALWHLLQFFGETVYLPG